MIDEIDVADMLDEMFSRVNEIKAIGGVALEDVVDGKATIPDGWEMDIMTAYYVPAWWLQLPQGGKAN